MNDQFKTLIATLGVALVGMLPLAGIAASDEAILERVQKIGRLNVGGQAAPAAAPAAADAASAPAAETAPAEAGAAATDPQALYQATCFACHGTGAAGAPVLGNKEMWAPRIAQGEDTLFEHAINGLNAMPPRGASTYSDDEIKAIIHYMVTNSQ